MHHVPRYRVKPYHALGVSKKAHQLARKKRVGFGTPFADRKPNALRRIARQRQVMKMHLHYSTVGLDENTSRSRPSRRYSEVVIGVVSRQTRNRPK